MNTSERLPLPAPDDFEAPAHAPSSSSATARVSAFLCHALCGQAIYSLLQLGVAASVTSLTKERALNWELGLLIVPLIFVVTGALRTRGDCEGFTNEPLPLAASIVGLLVLGLWNLLVLLGTAIAGYC